MEGAEVLVHEICESATGGPWSEGVFIVDAQGRYVDVNLAGCQMFGYTREEILGADERLLRFPKEATCIGTMPVATTDDQGRIAAMGPSPGDIDLAAVRMRRKDGSEIWVQVSASPFQVDGKALTLRIKRDVTERRRMEEVLRACERFLALLNDITHAAIETQDLPGMLQALVGRLGEVIEADACYLAMWDAEAQALAFGAACGAWPAAHLLVDADGRPTGPGQMAIAGVTLRAGVPLAVEDVRDTAYLDPRIAASFPYRSLLGLPLLAGDLRLGAALIAFCGLHRFTPLEIARCEQAARQIALAVAKTCLVEQVRRRVEELIFLNRVGRAVTSSLDLDQVLTTVMQEAKELLQAEAASVMLLDEESGELVFETAVGLGSEKAKGLRLPPGQGIAGWVARENRPLLVPDVKQTERFYRDIDLITGLATRSILAVPLQVRDQVIGVIEAVNKVGGHFTQADEELLSSLAQSAAIAVENARLYQDLHDRMEELKRTQAQLIQSAKLVAVGRLAAGVAHEINSPLTTVVGLAQLLLEDVEEGSPIKQDLQTINQEANRIRTIVKALIDFGGQQAGPWSRSRDVNAIVRSTIALATFQARRAGVVIRERYSRTLPPVRVDAEQIGQAFLHIVTNAIQAMPDGGELAVETACRAGGLDGVDCVAIAFRDTGAGIAPADLPFIFDPFFTTKEVGEGVGLGLTVSHGIVQSHGGKIEVESTLGQGSAFTVLLPVTGRADPGPEKSR